jgi:DNA-binding CsgD family transcriptional regulator
LLGLIQGVLGGAVLIRLLRNESAGSFTQDDEAEYRAAAHHVQFGLAANARDFGGTDFVGTERAAIILADELGRTIHATAQGRGMLALMAGVPLVEPYLAASSASEQLLLRELASSHDSESGHAAREIRSITRDTFWGRYSVTMFPCLDGVDFRGRLAALQIREFEPAVARLISRVNERGLSTQQAQIALGIAVGRSNQEMASALGISNNTLGYHLKRLYSRLNVHDRAELLAVFEPNVVQSRRTESPAKPLRGAGRNPITHTYVGGQIPVAHDGV